MLGKKHFLVLALLLEGCNNSTPPPIEVCILDGVGGGDCTETDGSHVYKTPSEMLNYWSTGESDESKLESWCYGSTPAVKKAAVKKFKESTAQ